MPPDRGRRADDYQPTIWDVTTFIGSFGLFFTMFCLFVRFLPMVAAAEVKSVLPQADPHHGDERVVIDSGGSTTIDRGGSCRSR